MRVNFGGAAEDAEVERGESHQVVRKSPADLFAMLKRRRDLIRQEAEDGVSRNSSLWKLTVVKSNARYQSEACRNRRQCQRCPRRRTPYRGPRARTLSDGACGKVDVDGPAESYMSVARNMSKGCPPSGS